MNAEGPHIEIRPDQGGYDGAEMPCHEDDEETQIDWSNVVVNEDEIDSD